MDKKLRATCIEAITVAACDNKWNCVLDLQLKDVVEQLEETNVKSPEAAVQMFEKIFTELSATHANEIGYSDVYPYEIVRRVSDKTIEIRAMDAALDPEWKPEFIPGGFCAHCVNQHSQRWVYSSNPNNPLRRIRLTKRGWRGVGGAKFRLGSAPRKFHDYNF